MLELDFFHDLIISFSSSGDNGLQKVYAEDIFNKYRRIIIAAWLAIHYLQFNTMTIYNKFKKRDISLYFFPDFIN